MTVLDSPQWGKFGKTSGSACTYTLRLWESAHARVCEIRCFSEKMWVMKVQVCADSQILRMCVRPLRLIFPNFPHVGPSKTVISLGEIFRLQFLLTKTWCHHGYGGFAENGGYIGFFDVKAWDWSFHHGKWRFWIVPNGGSLEKLVGVRAHTPLGCGSPHTLGLARFDVFPKKCEYWKYKFVRILKSCACVCVHSGWFFQTSPMLDNPKPSFPLEKFADCSFYSQKPDVSPPSVCNGA